MAAAVASGGRCRAIMSAVRRDVPMALSAQQTAAVNFIGGSDRNLIIEAVAGSGKTYTLTQMLSETQGNVWFCAFGAEASKDIAAKIAPLNMNDRVKVSTIHSFGNAALRKIVGYPKEVTKFKLEKLARQEFNGEYESLRGFVAETVDMAKQIGIGAILDGDDDRNWYDMCEHFNLFDSLPENHSHERGIDAARYLLNVSNSVCREIIDYADMVYIPILKKARVPQFDYVLLDEAQDSNPTRRALVRMAMKPTGRLIAVGDPRQAIFGFTGADHQALDNIRSEFNAETLPLSVTYRCPKSIVQYAQNWVSHIEAHESSPEGIVDRCELSEVAKLATQNDAILCRLTKPLVEMAYSLLRQSVACKVEGRQIGEGLIKLASKWKRVKTVGDLETKLNEWREYELAKYKAKGDESACQNVEDKADTLQVFIDQCDHTDGIRVLIAKIEDLFADTKYCKGSVLTLSTIHKSKGREWNRVFCIGIDVYSPSKWARKDWELLQEDNLCYVQVTRAKQHLTLVNVPAKDS